MRTTVTLDPDTHELVRNYMQECGLTFKQAINDGIRLGLAPEKKSKPFKQRTFRMGPMDPAIFNKSLQLAGELEDLDVIRKMQRDK
jgi:hypothetical protein